MTMRETMAERWKTAVFLDLPELSWLVNAAVAAGAGSRRADPDLARAARAVGRARDRRLRAVERAGGG